MNVEAKTTSDLWMTSSGTMSSQQTVKPLSLVPVHESVQDLVRWAQSAVSFCVGLRLQPRWRVSLPFYPQPAKESFLPLIPKVYLHGRHSVGYGYAALIHVSTQDPARTPL